MLKEIIISVLTNGGITYNYRKECRVITGYTVAIYPKQERSVKSLSEKNLIHYIHENYELLKEEENCLGIWYHNGYYILDIVIVVSNVYRALHIAITSNQTAIYDLDKGQKIYL